MSRARPINASAIEGHIDIVLLKASDRDIVGDSSLADLPHTIDRLQRLAHVLGGALTNLAHIECVDNDSLLVSDPHRLLDGWQLQDDSWMQFSRAGKL